MELGISLPSWITPVTGMSSEEYEQARCDAMNAESGNLKGEHCEICRDKGLVYYVKAGEIVCRPCECMTARENMSRIRKSGLEQNLEAYTFASYEAKEEWQKKAKAAAISYAKEPHGWFMLCGQVGAGKTHLCTAIVGELMKTGRTARYMLWRDEAVRLKSCVNDEAAYNRLMRPLKEADVLYIDDLFKTSGNASPTQGDINIAFELINYRYCQPESLTLFSCEMMVDDILSVDEAVGSRIYQRTKAGGCVPISRQPGRNYRMRKSEKA